MTTEPYEIEMVLSEPEDSDVAYGEVDFLLALMATVTGLSKVEIMSRLPAEYTKVGSWGGQGFVKMARLLGYDANPKFRKFDPLTTWPCILRVKVPSCWGWKGKWWALVYNQGTVYNVAYPGWQGSLARFQKLYRQCRITSMLQVWISAS
jgi:hypothetical protein